MASIKKERARVFISYSHHDAEWLARLRVHLKPLERVHRLEIWDDTMIRAGAQWQDEIQESLDLARVVVLLVSADFLASEFIHTSELPRFLDAAQRDGAAILPLILSPSRFRHMVDLNRFQAVNNPARPLVDMTRGEQEATFVKLSESIEEALKTESDVPEQAPVTGRVPERNLLIQYLKLLLAKTDESKFLTVSVGDFHVQFLSTAGDSAVRCEAVSENYLDMPNLKKKELIRLGFESPADDEDNYVLYFALDDEPAFQELADIALHILFDVYGCSDHSQLAFRIDS